MAGLFFAPYAYRLDKYNWSMKRDTKNMQVMRVLRTVIDPELGINIVDLGLVYRITVEDGNRVSIAMTLTTPGCPLAGMFDQLVGDAVQQLPWVERVSIQLTFDPPWTQEMMSEEARAQLGFD